MAHEFVILIGKELKTYTRYEDIPEVFDNVISFKPEISDPPHTEEIHEEIENWNVKFKKLMEREHAGRNKNW